MVGSNHADILATDARKIFDVKPELADPILRELTISSWFTKGWQALSATSQIGPNSQEVAQPGGLRCPLTTFPHVAAHLYTSQLFTCMALKIR